MIKGQSVGNIRGVSAPRSIVLLDGHSVNFLNWTVNLNSTHEADDFTITLPFKMTENLAQGYLSATPDYASYLFTNSDVLVEVFVGYPSNPNKYQTSDLVRIMYGYMDTAELDFSNSRTKGETVILTGRSMMAPFVNNKSTVKYQNMTSSAIASMLASSHGLKAVVTPTYTLAGKYFGGDTTAINSDSTEWDLLAFLADQEGFDIRVFDNTLYFGPFESVVGNVVNDALNYAWGQNIRDLTLSRSPHAAKDITVEVHSFDTTKVKHVSGSAKKQKVTYTTSTSYFTESAKSSTGKASSTTSYIQRYFIPGLTKDQAQKKAEAILNQLSKLEVTGTMAVAGNEKLTVDRLINIYGLGTGLSSSYYVRKASHNWDITSGDGYRVDVTFSNLLLMDDSTGGM